MCDGRCSGGGGGDDGIRLGVQMGTFRITCWVQREFLCNDRR